MTDVLHLPARPDAPIACDMSTAPDTPEQRLAEYRALYARALLRRERTPRAVVLAFRAEGGTRAAVDDLAHREAACCPFLDYRVETAGDEVIYTISSVQRADAEVALDAFYALPDDAEALTRI